MSNQTQSNKLRYFELCLVLTVAFARSVIGSISSLFSASYPYASRDAGLLVLNFIVAELSALGLLCYVLFRQGRALTEIGLSIRWKDVPISLLLFLGTYASYFVSYLVFYSIQNVLVPAAVTAPAIQHPVLDASLKYLPFIALLINPVFEEVIVRGYMITEVELLSRSTTIAVISSALLQTIYHLYQGVLPALASGCGFLFLSIYFVKKRRLLPVILAHLYFDMLALVMYRR
jgi:membrane protease YdiL (CAAX protease family)